MALQADPFVVAADANHRLEDHTAGAGVHMPRFPIGARVECNCGAWKAGTVVRHFYRQKSFEEGVVAPYQVKLDDGKLIFAPADVDRVIRRLCDDGEPADASLPTADPRSGGGGKTQKDVRKLLKDRGFELVRAKKHYIFKRVVNGVRQTTVMSKTPSDRRATRNMMADLSTLEEVFDKVIPEVPAGPSAPALLGPSNDREGGGGGGGGGAGGAGGGAKKKKKGGKR